MAEPLDDATRQLLRHTVATLAYRAGKVLSGVPVDFAAFRLTPASRSASEVLSQMVDLMGRVDTTTAAWARAAELAVVLPGALASVCLAQPGGEARYHHAYDVVAWGVPRL